MKKVWVLLFLICAGFVIAQEMESASIALPSEEVVYITLTYNHRLLDDLIVLVFLDDADPVQVITDNSGRFGIEKGAYKKLELKADDLATPGKDYYGEFTLEDVNRDIELELFQVGSIRGLVLDDLDNVVPNAELHFECDNEIGAKPPLKTNKFGAFTYDFSPIGGCKIYASRNNEVGFSEVKAVTGQIYDTTIRLDKNVAQGSGFAQIIVVLLLFVIVVGAGYFSFRFVTKKVKKESRSDNIMVTLSHKEQNVVKYLTECKKARSQNEISREVGIPKTSLRRVIEKLERKKIVEVENIGKYKKVKISEWFLGQSGQN